MSSNEEPGEFVFYHYDPSLPAAVIFISLFSITSLLHLYQLIRSRAWYFIPFLAGCVCKFPHSSLGLLKFDRLVS